MKHEININPNPHFLFVAEMQMAMHEYAAELKAGVKPEGVSDVTMGLMGVRNAMVGLVFGVQVDGKLIREVTISQSPPNNDNPHPEVHVEFLQVNNHSKSFASLFEKDAYRDVRQHRAVTVPTDSYSELGKNLTEDIFQFFFTGEIPQLLTY